MDREENITLKYLESKGYKNITYEPDGNIPPDFAIGSRLAIETRRLNQHHYVNGQEKSLEQLQYPLRHKIEKMLTKIKKKTINVHILFLIDLGGR
jgi:hypothetical protein